MLKIQSMSYHNSGILIWPKWFKHINSWHSKNLQNMSGLVQILRHDLIRFYKHVQTCSNIMTGFDTILQTCPNLSMILWHDLIRFYKHVQACSNIMIWFNRILQTCPDMFKYYDMIWYDSTRLKLKTWRNTLKLSKWHEESFHTEEKLFLGSLRASRAIKNWCMKHKWPYLMNI